MNFYPNLLEDTQEEDIMESGITLYQMQDILKKYLGGKVVIDANTEEVTHVGNKRYTSPIKDWEDIFELAPIKRSLLEDFLQEIFDEKGIDLNVSSVIKDIKLNKEKAREQAKGRAKTWEPKEIPTFPRIGLKYKDFWDHQIEKHKDDIESDKEKIISKEPKKVTIKDDEERELTLNVSPSLTTFFNQNKKEKAWSSFLSNIEKSGLSTISFINTLLDYMRRVVEDDISPGMVYRPTPVKLKLNTSQEVEKWKNDMLEYIGKYSNSNISNINEDDTYRDIMTKGTFLNTLLITEPKGVGRGEILMAYIMDGARFAGGGESFDVTCGGTTYELKDYSTAAGSSIRLGTHGKVTRFDWWDDINSIVKTAKGIRRELGDDKLKAILGNYFFRVWDLVTTKTSYTVEPRAVGTAIEAGELNTERLERLKLFCMLSHEIATRGKRDEEEGKYTFAIIKGSGVKPETINIEPLDIEDLDKTDSLKIDFDEDDLKKFKELSSLKFVKDPLKLQEDLNRVGKDYNEGALNVDYFMIFLAKEVIIDKPENFVFSSISQAGVKIKTKESKSDIESIADRAFKKWKKQEDESFVEIYKDEVAGLSESYYPRLNFI